MNYPRFPATGLVILILVCLYHAPGMPAQAPSLDALGPEAFAARFEDFATRSPAEAIAIGESALARLAPDEQRLRASILLSLGTSYRLRGDYPKAAELAMEAGLVAIALGAPLELGRSQNLQGIVLWRQGDLAAAQAQFERALATFRSAGLEDRATDATINMALIHYTQGNTATALSISLEALAAKRLIGDDIAVSGLLNNIGAMFRRQGDYERAIEHYFEALELTEAMGDDAGRITPLYNIGVTYQRWEQHDRALEYFRRSLDEAQAQGLERSKARAQAAIGESLMTTGDPGAAEPYLVEAAETFEALGNRPHLGTTLINLSRLYRKTGRLALSRDRLVRAEAIFREAGIDHALVSALEKRARTEMADGRMQLALTYLAQAEEVAARTDDAELEIDVLDAYVELHEANGEAERALESLRRRVELERAILTERSQARVAEMDSLYQASEARRALEESDFRREVAELELDRQRAGFKTAVMVSAAALALMIIALTLFLTRRNLRLANRHRQELETVVAERTAELQDANQDLRLTIGDLRATREQLIEAEKMAAVASLVAGVAHKINTPLGNAITAASLLDGTSGNAPAHGVVMENLQRIADLIGAFREVATDRAMEKRQRFDIGSYVADIVETLTAGEESKVRIHFDVQSLEVDSYPRVFLQVVGNLYLNSVRHGFPGASTGNIWISISAEGEAVRLVFRDDGCGMDEETRARVFEPFFTRAHATGSPGLGMHIVYKLVTQVLDGTITCQSSSGEGVRFELRFPKASPASRELAALQA